MKTINAVVTRREPREDTRDLLERALRLSKAARVDLAYRLLESVDDDEALEENEDPVAVERAWGKEVARRVRRILETGERGIPLDRVLADVREALALDRARRQGG